MPVLVNANRFPFLRIKKPQPASLSGIIRSTARTREKRLLRTEALKQERITALDEQQWDEILEYQLGVERDEGEKAVPWQGAIDDSLKEIRQRTDRAVKKRIAMAELMTDIVDKETALAREEHLQRQDKAHKIRKARRLKRQGRDPAASGLPLDELADLLNSNNDVEPDSSTASNTEDGPDSGRPASHSPEPGFSDSQNLINAIHPYESHDDSTITAPSREANQLLLAALMNGQSLREALTGPGQRSQGRWSQKATGENGWQARNDHHTVYRATINTYRLPDSGKKSQLVRVNPGASNNAKDDESRHGVEDISKADSDTALEREQIHQNRARRKEEKTRRKEEKARASEERARLHREAHERKKAAKLHEQSFAGRMKRWLRAHDLNAYESAQSDHAPPPDDSGTFAENGGIHSREAAKRPNQDL